MLVSCFLLLVLFVQVNPSTFSIEISRQSIDVAFADEENFEERQTRWLSYCSAISVALGGLLLFTSHWTYSLSSELQLPTLYIRYGFSTYLIVAAAVMSLLSMSLVLWRLVSRKNQTLT